MKILALMFALLVSFQINAAVTITGSHVYGNGWDTTAFPNTNSVVMVVASTNLIDQTTSLSSTVLYTAPTNGLYEVKGVALATTAATAGTVTVSLNWTDEAGATSSTAVNALTMAVLGRATIGPVLVSLTNGANLTYSTTVASVVGSPKYALKLIVERKL